MYQRKTVNDLILLRQWIFTHEHLEAHMVFEAGLTYWRDIVERRMLYKVYFCKISSFFPLLFPFGSRFLRCYGMKIVPQWLCQADHVSFYLKKIFWEEYIVKTMPSVLKCFIIIPCLSADVHLNLLGWNFAPIMCKCNSRRILNVWGVN